MTCCAGKITGLFATPPGGVMSDIEARVKKIIAEQLGVAESEVSPEKAFVAALGADSLATVDLGTHMAMQAHDSWAAQLAGRSGIQTIPQFDGSAFACQFAGEVKGFNIEDYIPAKEARHMDRFIHFGLAASMQAVKDAGLPTGDALSPELAERIGVLVGSGIGGLPMIEQTHTDYKERGPRRISPFFVPASIINMISGHVSIYHGFRG